MDNEQHRGMVQYTARFKQPLLFEGIVFDKIYPTDIDAFTEYHDKVFIIMEVKGIEVPLNYGQSTCLQRIVDTIEKAGKYAVLYVCRHNIVDYTQPIYLKDTIVKEAYYQGRWWNIKPIRAGELWRNTMEWARRLENENEQA